jgi:hypothetical protein
MLEAHGPFTLLDMNITPVASEHDSISSFDDLLYFTDAERQAICRRYKSKGIVLAGYKSYSDASVVEVYIKSIVQPAPNQK